MEQTLEVKDLAVYVRLNKNKSRLKRLVMKTFLLVGLTTTLFGCYADKELELQTVNVHLVKIDTVYRHPANEQVLTWQSDDNIRYVSYEPINKSFIVGSRFTVMMRK